MRQVILPDDAMVIRFSPTQPQTVLGKALMEHRRIGTYGLSVFADAPRPGEDRDNLIKRLLKASELDGMDPIRNKKVWVCARAGELLARGFRFYKYTADEDPNPPELPEHYSVDLGDVEPEPSVATVEKFLAPFSSEKRAA
jgi:hypothetical protein